MIGAIVSATLGSPRSRLVKALKPNSKDLMQLAEDFRPLAKNYAIASFYEEHVLRPAKHVVRFPLPFISQEKSWQVLLLLAN